AASANDGGGSSLSPSDGERAGVRGKRTEEVIKPFAIHVPLTSTPRRGRVNLPASRARDSSRGTNRRTPGRPVRRVVTPSPRRRANRHQDRVPESIRARSQSFGGPPPSRRP